MTSNVTPFRNVNHTSLLWAAPERANEIATLHGKLFQPPWTEDAVKALLEHPASTSLVAITGEPKRLVGFVIGMLAADEAEIISIGIAPDWQRAGLGTKLLEGLIRAAKRGEARRLFLEVAADNTAGLALYNKLQFAEVGRRPRYYERPGAEPADALVLSRDL